MGSSVPSAPGPSTERNHALPESGGSSWTTSLDRTAPVTPLAHRSSRFDTSAPAATGASKRRPVEAGHERLGHRRGRAGGRGRGRQRRLAGGHADDRVDHRPEHVEGDGPGVAARDHGDRAGHGRGEALEQAVVDERRHPLHTEVEAAALLRLGARQGRGHRAPGHEAHRLHRHPAQPRDAGAHTRAVAAAADGDQPAEGVGHRDGEGGRLEAAAERHVGVDAPAEAGTVDRLEPVGQGVVVLRFGVGTGRPHHDLAGRPGRLQPDLAGGLGVERRALDGSSEETSRS